ncbi:hypothetical protein [Aerococcus urinae]
MSDRTLAQELSAMRRYYHRFPEPAWMEYRTTISIINRLKALGYEVKYGKTIHNPDCMMGLPKKTLPSPMLPRLRKTLILTFKRS